MLAFEYEIDRYLEINKDYFGYGISDLKQLILNSNIPMVKIKNIKLKSPKTAKRLSMFLGFWGIDRLYIGDYLFGIVKGVSHGFVFFGWIFDIYFIENRTRIKNTEKLLDYIRNN